MVTPVRSCEVLAALAVVSACSSTKTRPAADDAVPGLKSDADGPGDAGTDAAPEDPGDLAVRVLWTDVPAAARASPGTTPCHTPRAPLATPTTTWGLPGAIVLVEAAAAPAEARIALVDCALVPRVAVGSALELASRMLEPQRIELARWGSVRDLAALAAPAKATAIQLPTAGHAVTVALEAGGVYRLATTAKPPEVAWIVAAPAAITDRSGSVTFAKLPAGKHRVTAWLPPRAGHAGKLARGEAEVPSGGRVELVLDLAKP